MLTLILITQKVVETLLLHTLLELILANVSLMEGCRCSGVRQAIGMLLAGFIVILIQSIIHINLESLIEF